MSELHKVSTQRLRNAADFMRDTTGVDPTWLRAAADEIDLLRESSKTLSEALARACDEATHHRNQLVNTRTVLMAAKEFV